MGDTFALFLPTILRKVLHMCVSLAPAHFSKTTILAHQTRHPETGEAIVVLGYQNTAKSLTPGPNAMLIHVPAYADIGPENMLDTSMTPNLLKDVGRAVKVTTRGVSDSMRLLGAKSAVQVFEHGIYTVVSSNDIRAAHEALAQVDEKRRPAISSEVVEFYATKFPYHRFLFFCFNNTDAVKATPTLFWYKPSDPSILVAPGIDSHDGGAPNLDAHVDVDHTVVFGHSALPNGARVSYSDVIPGSLRPYLPTHVKGRDMQGMYRNGDFAVLTSQLLGPAPISVYRLTPAHFPPSLPHFSQP